VNKLDIVGYSREVFDRIEGDYRTFAHQIGLEDITAIPLSALKGDNVTSPSANTPWYQRPGADGVSRDRAVDDEIQRRALPDAGTVGQPPQPGLPAASPGRVAGGVVRPGIASACCRPAPRAR